MSGTEFDLITTDDPEEEELTEASKIVEECNASDGTHYGPVYDADLYIFAYDEQGRMMAVLAAYAMGGTFRGSAVTEAAAFVRPAFRRQGILRSMLEALKEEPEGEGAIRFAVYETALTAAVLRAIGAEKEHDELMMQLIPDGDRLNQLEAIAEESSLAVMIEPEEWDAPVPLKDADGPSEDGIGALADEVVRNAPQTNYYCHSAYSELHIRTGSGSAYIYGVQTASSMLRKHCAKRLLARVILHFHKQGYERFLLEVSDTNLPAVSLYRKLGFAEADRLSYYYEMDKCL